MSLSSGHLQRFLHISHTALLTLCCDFLFVYFFTPPPSILEALYVVESTRTPEPADLHLNLILSLLSFYPATPSVFL